MNASKVQPLWGKKLPLDNVQSSAEDSDPGPGMGSSPKNKSFHYSNKNVKHDKETSFLSKKNETMSISKPKPKGHSLISVRVLLHGEGLVV